MQLCKKQKDFSDLFAPFLKSTSTLEHFQTKNDPHSLPVLKTIDCQRGG